MLTFIVGYETQPLPTWLSAAIHAGTVTVKGDSTSDVRYYTVNGITAGPGQCLVFDGKVITVEG